jgi:hypothetical protein
VPTEVSTRCQLPTHGDVTPVGLPSKIRSTAHLPFHPSCDASTLVLRWRCFFRHPTERPQVSSLIPVAAPHCRFRTLPLPFLAALLRISSATYIPTSIALLSRTVFRNRSPSWSPRTPRSSSRRSRSRRDSNMRSQDLARRQRGTAVGSGGCI